MSDYPIAPLMVITVCHTALHTPLDTALHTAHSIIHCTTHCTSHSTQQCTTHCTLHYRLHYTLHCTLHSTPESDHSPAQFDGKQNHQEGIILQFSKIVTHVIRVFKYHSLTVLQLCNIFLTLCKITFRFFSAYFCEIILPFSCAVFCKSRSVCAKNQHLKCLA